MYTILSGVFQAVFVVPGVGNEGCRIGGRAVVDTTGFG
jgi:hypothetical protein